MENLDEGITTRPCCSCRGMVEVGDEEVEIPEGYDAIGFVCSTCLDMYGEQECMRIMQALGNGVQ